jgi:hypothetical protein
MPESSQTGEPSRPRMPPAGDRFDPRLHGVYLGIIINEREESP